MYTIMCINLLGIFQLVCLLENQSTRRIENNDIPINDLRT